MKSQKKYLEMETKVYLSGGMNESNWQRQLIEEVSQAGFVYYNPREHHLHRSKEYAIWDLYYVKNCDIVFAYMQKENPSGYGLTLEVGVAAGLGKPIILVDERSADDEVFEKYFKIVRESASIVFDNFGDGVQFLKNLRNGIM